MILSCTHSICVATLRVVRTPDGRLCIKLHQLLSFVLLSEALIPLPPFHLHFFTSALSTVISCSLAEIPKVQANSPILILLSQSQRKGRAVIHHANIVIFLLQSLGHQRDAMPRIFPFITFFPFHQELQLCYFSLAEISSASLTLKLEN